MVSLSLGQIAEQAGVRPPGSSSNSESNWKSRSGPETPGTAAGIASGYAVARVPEILEPAPVSGSASSGSTVGLTAAANAATPAAHQAERSASATDLYERAIRDAEVGSGRGHQPHGSDPVRPVTRSTSTPPDERSSAPAPPKAQREQQARQQRGNGPQGVAHASSSPHLHPPSAGHVNFSQQQQQSQVSSRQGNARDSSSGQGSDNSPNSDPSPGSHASTSIIPEHHRIYATPYMSPNPAGPYGRGMPPAPPGSAGHFSASSSPSYMHHNHNHQQQNPTYAYHTQYYAPQYHYPPPNDGNSPYYAVAGNPPSHSPENQQGLAPQTFYPQTFYYSTGQVLHTAASSPNSAAHLPLDDRPLSHGGFSDDMSNGHQIRPFSAQSSQQSYGHSAHQQQQYTHPQQRLPAGMAYQMSPQPGVPTYVTYPSAHAPHNQMMHAPHSPNMASGQSQYHYQSMNNPPTSPVLAPTYVYNQQGNHRPSVDMGQQHHYRPMQFSPVSPQSFNSPSTGGGVGGGQHLRFSTADSAFSASTPYTNHEQSSGPSSYNPQARNGTANGKSSAQPTELARGHLAQSKFREAVGAYDPNARLPISSNEQKRTATGDARLPKPPSHSPWAMWVGNVPSDATHSELWRFFSSRPPPGNPPPGSDEEREAIEAEAPYLAPGEPQPDYNTVGIESVHLISRSNCCFVNIASKRHLDHAIKVSHGLSLRPHDPRCKPLVCRIRKKDDDNKTGVGAQRGKGMHQAWAAEKQKVKGLADAEAEIAAIVLGEAPSAVSIAVGSDGKFGHTGSASTTHSTTSTTSSFLGRHFPRRYFILKSHSEDDLHLSVERGFWATQSHNEPVLDQAFRTAQNVFLVFGANKSGEFFGYAKMAGPIFKPEKRSSRSSSTGQDGDHSNAFGKSGSLSGRKPEPSILETPEDENVEDSQPASNLAVPPVPSIISPSAVVSNSPQPLSNAPTPASPVPAGNNLDYLTVKASQHYTAPSPGICEKSELEARKGASLDPSVLAGLAQMNLGGSNSSGGQQRPQSFDKAAATIATNDQLLAGASSRSVDEDEGVFRKDTLLSPEERNARLERLEPQDTASQTPGERSLKDVMEQGVSKPFKIEWIRVQKLPFYRTRHLRNAFNGNREVKISRDGTEIEPDVGQQLLELFWKDPAMTPSQQTSPRTKSNSVASPTLS